MKVTVRPTLSANMIMGGSAVLFGFLVYLMMPDRVVLNGDDFAYLKSVIQTLQYGRPWTNDWLEPWAASFSAFSALTFKATGNFYFSTFGLVAGYGAVAFGGLTLLFKERGYSAWFSFFFSVLIITFPTILGKTTEFNAITLNLPTLLIAIWAVERKRWGLFFAVWIVAIASRQSALVWLAFPGLELIRNFFGKDRMTRFSRWLHPLLIVVAGFAVFLFLMKTMNRTHSDEVDLEKTFLHIDALLCLKNFAIGFFVFLIAAGLGGFCLGFHEAAAGQKSIWERPEFTGLVVFALASVTLLLVDVRPWVWPGLTGYLANKSGWAFSKVILILAAAGWISRRFTLNRDKVIVACGSLLLVCTREIVRDYYFMDVIVLGLFSVTPQTLRSETSPRKKPNFAKLALLGMPLLLIALFQARALWRMKVESDRRAARCLLTEEAFRLGRLKPSQLAVGGFGLMGWHLHPYFISHEGKTDRQIWRFTEYDTGGIEVITSPRHWSPLTIPANRQNAGETPDLIAAGTYREGWIFQVHYELRVASPAAQTKPPHSVPLDLREFSTVPFPLNNSEWVELAQGTALTPQTSLPR